MKWIPVEGLKKKDLPMGNVLVTNNPTAKDSHGNMSNIWLAYMDKKGKEYVASFIPDGAPMGVVIKISNVTHYCIPVFDSK